MVGREVELTLMKVSLSLHSLPSLKEAGVMASMLAPMRLMDLIVKAS